MRTATPTRRSSSKSKSSAANRPAPAGRLVKKANEAAQPIERPTSQSLRQVGYYDAKAKVALLRRDKRPPHDELLVDFSAAETQLELRVAGNLLIQGNWNWQATSSGRSLTAQGQWEEVAWHHEKSCDFLEIELSLSHGFKLERQVFLARNDQFLFLADCLVGPKDVKPGEIRHQ